MEKTVMQSADFTEKGNVVLSAVQLRSRSYRPDIDGLRSLAILSVVLYHAGVRRISGGFTGVDVFFAISGYLIGGHISSELRAGVFRFSNFYRNRAKRILPALYVVLAGVLALGLVLLSPHEFRDLAKYTFSTTSSVSNIMFWRSLGYFAPDADQNPLLMTWSLGVEEQFYLVIPVLLVLIARIRKQYIFSAIVLVSLASFVIATYQVSHAPNAAFYLLTARAWELGVGVALAIFEVEGRRLPILETPLGNNLMAWLGFILLAGPFFLLTPKTPFPGAWALPSVVGASLLLSSSGAWFNRKVLSLPFLVFIGRVSYSFYLVHWPILTFLRILLGKTPPETWNLLALAVGFGLAMLSYYFIEKPFRASKLLAGPLLWRYGAVSLILLLTSATIYMSGGLPGRYPRAATVDKAAFSDSGPAHDICLAKSGTTSPNLTAICSGAGIAGPHIALWGDSHASAIATTLRSASAQQGFAMEEYAKTSCPPLSGAGRSYRLQPAELGDCIIFNAAVLNRLIAAPQVQVVVLDSYWDGSFDPNYTDEGKLAVLGHNPAVNPSQAETEALLKASLIATVKALLDAKKQVIVFGDTPVFDVDPIWRMRTSDIPVRFTLSRLLNRGASNVDPGSDQAFDDNPPQNAGRQVLRETAMAIPGVRYWDVRSHLCNERDLCAYREGDTPLFADSNHVSNEGAEKILEGWKIVSP